MNTEAEELALQALRHLHLYTLYSRDGLEAKALEELNMAWRSVTAAFAARLSEYPGYRGSIASMLLTGGVQRLLEGLASERLPARLDEALRVLEEALRLLRSGGWEGAAHALGEAIEAVLDSSPTTLCRQSPR